MGICKSSFKKDPLLLEVCIYPIYDNTEMEEIYKDGDVVKIKTKLVNKFLFCNTSGILYINKENISFKEILYAFPQEVRIVSKIEKTRLDPDILWIVFEDDEFSLIQNMIIFKNEGKE